jgi:uncharacterized protein YkwD
MVKLEMIKVVSRIGLFGLILSLFASAQPVLAEGGVIGTPPEKPDPTNPSLQYSGCGGQIVPAYNAAYEERVIDLVNQERTSRGLTPLVRSAGLTNAARYQAADMSQDNYFSHATKDRVGGELVMRCDPWERIATYYSGAKDENAAAGYYSPEAAMNAWMSSSPHRAHILNPDTRAIGVGFYQGEDYLPYWIQDFGTQIDSPVIPTLGSLPENLLFMYSIPDQKLYPPHQYFTPANVGSSDQLSWQVNKSGSFFSVSPGNGITPTQIRITPDNFNHNQVNTYSGTVTVNVTDPSSVAGSPHTVQIKLMVLNDSITQVFLPGIHK